MSGPVPKPTATRQRRNRHSTAAQLESPETAAGREVPALFQRTDGVEWHPMVLEWWAGVWRSPMAAEYLEADMLGGLYLLADLHQLRWTAESRSALLSAAAEIRLQEVRFGLSPIDRRRLQWEVERGETAARATAQKRRPQPDPAVDPRAVLRAVS